MSPISNPKLQMATLRGQIVEQVRQDILRKRLKPGDHVREQDFTERLGVSRTPIREAFIILERDGLLVNYPNRGSYVRNFDEQDIEEIFTIRVALENLAARLYIDKLTDADITHLRKLIEQQALAVEHEDYVTLGILDRAFHRYLIELSGYARLLDMWDAIAAQYMAVISYRASAFPDYDEHQAMKDHEYILSALESHDLARIQAANEEINTRVANQCREGLARQMAALEETKSPSG